MNTKRLLESALAHANVLRPGTITEAANMALGLSGVKVGSDVAVIDDPTWSVAGLKGKVKKIDDVGHATVELANGTEIPLMVNQLIAL